MKEHLHTPITLLDDSIQPQERFTISTDDFSNNFIGKVSDKTEQKLKSLELKWMYDMIHETVMPRWKKYLQLKSERSIDTQIKPRLDTLWKKIFRDVREFFRILFRFRFQNHEFKDDRGAITCVKTFFDELGIPLTEEEVYDNKLFRFVHQTHKLKSNYRSDLVVSPYESIEKFNEIYKNSFMTNFTCARMFYFVYHNFLEEYLVHIKSRYRKDVITMICMSLNCYKRMSSSHHIKRIWFLLN